MENHKSVQPDPTHTSPEKALSHVEVIYAEPSRIWRSQTQLPAGATVADALSAAGFFQAFPQFSPSVVQVGIYGRKCTLDTQVHNSDRLEVYRPLIFEPMESRRRRARHKQRQKV